METVKTQFSKLTSNPIGAIAGGFVAFWAAKKYASVSNKWALGGIAIVGAVAGAMAQSKMKAKASAPALKK